MFALVTVPQAFQIAIPAFSNLMIELLKATSLASLLGLNELMFRGYQLNMATLQTGVIFLLIAAFGLIIAGAISGGFRMLELRFTRHYPQRY